MTTAGLVCGSCGTEVSAKAKFCNECGSPIAVSGTPGEYKQVTVLFADVVHSMDIAATVGAERLREIMTELVDRATAVVQRYGGTVDKFTGDGIMTVFGAPAALENHAFRACLAALDIQAETAKLAKEVDARDAIALQLRVGLNSGSGDRRRDRSGCFGLHRDRGARGHLRGLDARGGSPVEKRLGDTEMPARERLLAIFDIPRSEVVRGCPFHDAAVESAGSLASADEIVRTHKQEFTRRLVAVAREAGAADPHLLGHQLAVLFGGASAMATSLNDTAPVVHARAAAATLIDAALAASDHLGSRG